MKCKCPNCKGDATAKIFGGVEYIECQACGWFEKQDDGTWTACDKPQNQVDPGSGSQPDGGAVAVDAVPPVQKPIPSAKPAGGGSQPPPEPADEEDEGGLEVTLTDEIDY